MKKAGKKPTRGVADAEMLQEYDFDKAVNDVLRAAAGKRGAASVGTA